MKKIITITLILCATLFTIHGLLAQEEITDADTSYTVLSIYEDHIINQMSVTEHYEWDTAYQGDGVEVTMTARVE